VLEEDKSKQISQRYGNHKAQEIDVVSEVDGFLSAAVTNCDGKGTEEQSCYYAACQGQI
jgi:hypothetical protein